MCTARFITASVFILALVPFLAFAQSSNLIQNPGLETANGSVPSSWAKTYWGTPAPTFKYPDVGRSGNGAGISFGANSSGDARWAHSPVAVEPNATYVFSSWYKSSVTTEVNIEFTALNGTKSYSWFANLPSSGNAWKQFTGSIKVPSNAAKLTVFHLIDKKGTLVIDDYSLAKGGTGTTTPPSAPTLAFTANPTSIQGGQSASLTWSTTNTTVCTASGAWAGAKATSGTQTVSPTANATYSLTCTGASGTAPAAKSVTVTVNATPPGGFSEGMVSFTFDDSWTSQYTNVVPVLQAAGLKGTFYLTTQPIQESWDTFMTPSQVKDIAGKGHEIAGHTVSHADLTTLSQSQVNAEIRNSKTYLQNLTGKPVTSFAYPYGAFNTSVKSLLQQAGYTSARGVEYDTRNTAASDKFNLKSMCIETSNPIEEIRAQIDAAKVNAQWFVLCIHEVKSGGDQWTMTPAKFQAVVDYVKQSGIKVVTVQQGRALMQ